MSERVSVYNFNVELDVTAGKPQIYQIRQNNAK